MFRHLLLLRSITNINNFTFSILRIIYSLCNCKQVMKTRPVTQTHMHSSTQSPTAKLWSYRWRYLLVGCRWTGSGSRWPFPTAWCTCHRCTGRTGWRWTLVQGCCPFRHDQRRPFHNPLRGSLSPWVVYMSNSFSTSNYIVDYKCRTYPNVYWHKKSRWHNLFYTL